jgi:3-hydroxy-9,10-secoandrosta-1,3,5(10)-triene-9,17-dione monooxygenase reductase component
MKPIDPSKVYRLLYPAVPAILCCEDGGSTYAMPVVSIVAISGTPPFVGIASAPSHSTHQAVIRAGCFSLSWVDAALSRAVEVLGTTQSTTGDKLRSAGLAHTPGEKLGTPMIDGAAASLECSLHSRHSLGDHELIVGLVEDARASDDFQDYWRFESYEPLLYAGIRDGSLRTYRASRGRGAREDRGRAEY